MMITQFEKYTSDSETIQNQDEIDHIVQEYLGSFEHKLYCFESYWDSNIYNGKTCKPFIENLSFLTDESIDVGYRFFETKEQLKFHLQWPHGIIWENPSTWATSALYVSCHGSNNGLDLPMGLITKEDLLEVFENFGSDTSNILYFSSCRLFEDEDFGPALLDASKSQGVIGYKKEVGFTTGLITDLLFFTAFYLFKDGNPFDNLQQIFDAVIETFPPAKEMGWTLYI